MACIAAQQEWRQIHHLCYWELMWAYSFELRWKEAYHYADLLCKENKWSQVQQPTPPLNCSHFFFNPLGPSDLLLFPQAVYAFQKAAILSMLPEKEVTALGENVVEIFRLYRTAVGLRNAQGILGTVGRLLQAGGRSQDEDCWEIHSH